MSDEIYSELTYGFEHTTIASLPGMRERTILINGFSKAFAMTGWRLGYACGQEEIIQQMTKIHQFAIMCAPTTAQYAAVGSFEKTGIIPLRKCGSHMIREDASWFILSVKWDLNVSNRLAHFMYFQI